MGENSDLLLAAAVLGGGYLLLRQIKDVPAAVGGLANQAGQTIINIPQQLTEGMITALLAPFGFNPQGKPPEQDVARASEHGITDSPWPTASQENATLAQLQALDPRLGRSDLSVRDGEYQYSPRVYEVLGKLKAQGAGVKITDGLISIDYSTGQSTRDDDPKFWPSKSPTAAQPLTKATLSPIAAVATYAPVQAYNAGGGKVKYISSSLLPKKA